MMPSSFGFHRMSSPSCVQPDVLHIRIYFLWEKLLVVLVGGRLYALAHGVRQKVAHLGVAAGAAVRGVWMWWKAHA